MRRYILICLLITVYYSGYGQEDMLCQGAFWTEAEGAKFMKETAERWTNVYSWQQRAGVIKRGIIKGSGWDKLPQSPGIPAAIVRSSKRMDGYIVENVAIESFPGFYVTGNIYRPAESDDMMPLVLCPHGHWNQPGDIGRWRSDMQKRCAMLARMGALVFAYDLVGYAESTQVSHHIPIAFTLQLYNGKRALDYLLSRDDIDSDRVAITGASGGGTQSFMLTALDDRIKVSVPVVMVSAHFFGGCVCESGMPVHRAEKHQTNNVEIAGLAAPRPMLVISDGGDWTSNNPMVEIPYLKKIYDAYELPHLLNHAHFPAERHDYGFSKRAVMYNFLQKHLDLEVDGVLFNKDTGQFDESFIRLLPEDALRVFDAAYPRPADALEGDEEVIAAFSDLQE